SLRMSATATRGASSASSPFLASHKARTSHLSTSYHVTKDRYSRADRQSWISLQDCRNPFHSILQGRPKRTFNAEPRIDPSLRAQPPGYANLDRSINYNPLSLYTSKKSSI